MSKFSPGQSGNPQGAPEKALRLSERRRDVLLKDHTIDLDHPAWKWLRVFYPKADYTVSQLKKMAKKAKIKGYSKMRKADLMDALGMMNGRLTMPLSDIITLRRVYLFAADRIESFIQADGKIEQILITKPDYRAIETLENRTEGLLESGEDERIGGPQYIMFVPSKEHEQLNTDQRQKMIEGSFKD